MGGTPIKDRLRQALFASLGVVCVVLGTIGIFVPVLPTTVFVLAASYLFARSSPRLDRWLRTNAWLGPSLRRFAERGGMSVRGKAAAAAAMWAALAFSWFALSGVLIAQIGLVALGLAGTATLLWGVRTAAEPPLPPHGVADSRPAPQ